MIWALLLVPALSGLVAFFLRSDGLRRTLLVLATAAHSALVITAWLTAPECSAMGGWLALDSAGVLFLGITSALFLAGALYAIGYLSEEGQHHRTDIEEGFLFKNYPEATFTGCLLLFLSTMTLVAVAQHVGLLWVGVEATTLATAPLIYFHRHHRSLEAAWKYLLICSVGIGLALLGNFFLAAATAKFQAGHPLHLVFPELVEHARDLDPTWLRAGFLMVLVGYGTKMGLAPLHTWLPDAHSEAPSVVSALLSGALLNCAFLAILRMHGVLVAAGQGAFSQDLLVMFGLVSMTLAAFFIVGQLDFKRMLAYSSVEHVGILALGVGLGGVAGVGSMLHAVNHSLTKGALFMVAGNILAAYRTKSTREVRGVVSVLPVTGALWVAGFLAITGTPPFGVFQSELMILKGAVDAGRLWVAALYLLLLGVVFVGMARIVIRMAYGHPAGLKGLKETGGWSATTGGRREARWSIVPPALLGAAVLGLGLYVPPVLRDLIEAAAAALGAKG
jgi:hydrogenase-4 component F